MKTLRHSLVQSALPLLSLAFVACAAPASDPGDSASNEDGRDELKEKKGVVGGVAEGSPLALGILQVVNELSLSNLRDLVGLPFDTAYPIDLFKDPNGFDDDLTFTPFTSLAQLQALPGFSVGEFSKLKEYAIDHGYTGDTSHPICTGKTCVYHPITRASLSAVHGTSENDVWAVGQNGVALHWDGAAWSTVAPFTKERLKRVFAIATNDVYALSNTSLYHFDGSSWSAISLPGITSLSTIWASGRNDVFVGGARPPSPSVTSIVHFDGASWTESPDFSEKRSDKITVVHGGVSNVTGNGSGKVYMDTSDSYVYEYDYATNRWTLVYDLNNGVFGTGLSAIGDRLYAVSQYEVLEIDIATKKTRSFTDRAIGVDAFSSVHGTSTSDLYLASTFSPLSHFDGTSWRPVYPENTVYADALRGVYAPPGGGAWTVGDEGVILHTSK